MRWVDVDAGSLTVRVLDREGFSGLAGQLDDAAALAAATLRPARVGPRVPGSVPAPTDQH